MMRVFENLINGNLTDAKRGAKHYSMDNLINFAMDNLGWHDSKAIAAVEYLKGQGSFQNYADFDDYRVRRNPVKRRVTKNTYVVTVVWPDGERQQFKSRTAGSAWDIVRIMEDKGARAYVDLK